LQNNPVQDGKKNLRAQSEGSERRLQTPMPVKTGEQIV
jgi:hypothetical protein